MKRNPKQTLRNKADKLLQQYIKLIYANCLLCDNPISCGHHFFTKASSNALRYHISNIIPLCQKCHYTVHCQPYLIEPRICFIYGQDWYNELVELKRERIKANRIWYQNKVDELEALIHSLENKTTEPPDTPQEAKIRAKHKRLEDIINKRAA